MSMFWLELLHMTGHRRHTEAVCL